MCLYPPKAIITIITLTSKYEISNSLFGLNLSPKYPLINNPMEYTSKNAVSIYPSCYEEYFRSSYILGLHKDHDSLVK